VASDTPQPSAPARLIYFDWLRVLLLALLIVSNLLSVFVGDGPISNRDVTPFLGFLRGILVQVGVPLLLALSGASLWLSASRRSWRAVLEDRVLRLLVPFAFAAVAFGPVTGYLSARNHQLDVGTFFDYLPRFFNLDRLGGPNPQWLVELGYPLWILGLLFAFALIGLPLIWLLRRPGAQRLLGRLDRVLSVPGVLIALALPLFLLQIALRQQPGRPLIGWADIAPWLGYFLLGLFIFSQPRLIAAVRRDWPIMIGVLLLTLVVGLLIAYNYLSENVPDVLAYPELAQRLINTFLSTWLWFLSIFGTWAWVLLILSLSMRLLNRETRFLRAARPVALPYFVLFHPVLVVFAFYIVLWDVPFAAKMLAVFVLPTLVTLGLVVWLVRPLTPLRFLTGMRPARAPKPIPAAKLAAGAALAVGVAAFAFIQEPVSVQTAFAPPPGWDIITPPGDLTCVHGDPYYFFHRPGADPDKLLIYFQAGGACWNAVTCAPGSLAYDQTVGNELAGYGGIFDSSNPENPVSDYSAVFIPNCSGDLFAGNATVDYGGGIVINHDGYRIAQATLDWVYANYPNPAEVLVTGSSAGSIGSIVHAPEILTQYPNARTTQFGDGFVGVMPQGWPVFELWDVFANVPDFVPGLADLDPDTFSLNDIYLAVAAYFPETEFGQFTHGVDPFQAGYYLLVGGDPTTWQAQMLEALGELQDALPNFSSYVARGAVGHTTLVLPEFYTNAVDGLRFVDWFRDYIEGRPVPVVR
jgi:hypothetical protein